MYTNKLGKAYYCRTFSDKLIDRIKEKFSWIFDFVKEREELDFQTGYDPKTGESWFSVYRGTGRILTIECSKNGVPKELKVAESYKEIGSGFFNSLSQHEFEKYLDRINNNDCTNNEDHTNKKTDFSKYYASNKKKYEGYYQNLLSRRYTFLTPADAPFIIIDKEFVLGFKSEEIKNEWREPILRDLSSRILEAKEAYGSRLPKDIKSSYAEVDFLALDWEGNLWIMELKQNDPSKTYQSPIQVCYYFELLSKFMKEDIEYLYNNIRKMVEQKIALGMITLPEGRELPSQLSGKIKTAVIVGEDQFSDETKKRFRFFRNYFLPDMKAYTCENDGTIKPSSLD